jgi:hypothetical protein
MTAPRLTPQQRRAIDAIDGDRASMGEVSIARLADLLDTSRHGAAATAHSLVRRGMLERRRRDGHVVYARVLR